MTRALYPGTFDPVTLGHLDLMERALRVFDHLVVAVSSNPSKRPLFGLEERLALLRESTRAMTNLEIIGFDGLLVNLIRDQKADLLVKGLRAVSDFEYEMQMALTNRKLNPRVETAFLMPSEQYTYLSSTIVKEVASLGGEVGPLVPPAVEKALREKFRNRG